jgi:hypothetical protein
MLKPEKNLRWLGLDMRPRWRRRSAVILTYLAFITVVVKVEAGGYWGHPALTTLVLTLAVFIVGIFSGFGPVKSFEPPPNGSYGSKYILVNGLDDLARYRYDVPNYDAASDEQKSDLLQTYHVGMRLYPRKSSLNEQYWLDEREKQERIGAEQWARRWLMTMMAITLGRYLERHTAPQPLEVAGDLLWLLILAQTLPPARILWTEPDPREAPGEIELVPN